MSQIILIRELDDKYVIIKKSDLGYLAIRDGEIDHLNHLLKKISAERRKVGKEDNRYVVLNLDDEIDLKYLIGKLMEHEDIRFVTNTKIQVKDIAVDLVNAILKAKEAP